MVGYLSPWGYATYQARTTRIIPLVMMQSVAAIPVFSEADLATVEREIRSMNRAYLSMK
jgi:hypothetical protein